MSSFTIIAISREITFFYYQRHGMKQIMILSEVRDIRKKIIATQYQTNIILCLNYNLIENRTTEI